jgi:hypothetical protein
MRFRSSLFHFCHVSPRSTPAAPFCIRGTRARSTETRFRRNTASSFHRRISRSEGSRRKSVGSGYAGEVWSVYKPPARHSTSCLFPTSRLLPSRLSSNSLCIYTLTPFTLPTKQKTTTLSKCLPPLGPSEFLVGASAGGVFDRGSSSYRRPCLSALLRYFLPCSPCAGTSLDVSRITTTLNTGAKMPIFGLGTWQSAVGLLSTSSLLFPS